jgi:methionyl-tRNA formyltransferase
MKKEDGHLDPHADPYQNYLKYCAYDEWPGTYFVVERHGKTIRVKVNDAKYENGEFVILRVTPEGKREMSYEDYLRAG